MISFRLYQGLFPILENLVTQWPGCFWHLHAQHNIPKSVFVRSQIPMDSTCRCINCFTNLRVLLCLSILLKILLFLFLLCVIVRALCWFIKSHVCRQVMLLLNPTLCDPIDGRPSGFPIPGILQARTLGVDCHFFVQCMKVKSESEVAQSCPTLSDPIDCSLPGSSVHGILQARVLEWGCHHLSVQFSSLQFSRSVVSNSLRPHESQHATPPCPLPTPRVHSDSHPSNQ